MSLVLEIAIGIVLGNLLLEIIDFLGNFFAIPLLYIFLLLLCIPAILFLIIVFISLIGFIDNLPDPYPLIIFGLGFIAYLVISKKIKDKSSQNTQ